MQRQYLWIGDADGQQTQAGMGGPRKEVYSLEIIVDAIVEGEGDTAASGAETQCFAIQAELENQLRTDPTINGAVFNAQIGRFKLTDDVAREGMTRVARLVTLVNCQAYI